MQKGNFALEDSLTFSFLRIFIYLERGEGTERERNIDVRELHQLVASRRCPNRGPGPQTPACASTRSRIGDLPPCGTTRNQLSHTRQGSVWYFLTKLNILFT